MVIYLFGKINARSSILNIDLVLTTVWLPEQADIVQDVSKEEWPWNCPDETESDGLDSQTKAPLLLVNSPQRYHCGRESCYERQEDSNELNKIQKLKL